jgi:hypothetical protein
MIDFKNLTHEELVKVVEALAGELGVYFDKHTLINGEYVITLHRYTDSD